MRGQPAFSPRPDGTDPSAGAGLAGAGHAGAGHAGVGFEEFFAGQYRHLAQAAYLLCGDEAEAEDLTAEAFAAVLGRWAVAESSGQAAVLVWRALARRAADRAVPPVATHGPGTAAAIGPAGVIEALQAMPVKVRLCLVLHQAAGLAEEDVATVLGLPQVAVRRRVALGLRMLSHPPPHTRPAIA